MDFKNEKVLRCLAGGLFLLTACLQLMDWALDHRYYLMQYPENIAAVLGLALTGLGLLVNRRKISIAGTVFYAIAKLYILANELAWDLPYNAWYWEFDSQDYLLPALCAAALCALLLLFSCRREKLGVKIWFVPGLLLLLSYAWIWNDFGYFDRYMLQYVWHEVLLQLSGIAAFFVFGLALRSRALTDKTGQESAG